MFNCYNHGWSHIEKECPRCFPFHTITNTTTSNVISVESLIGITGSEYERLKALESKLAKAREALKFYANDSWDLGCGCCQINDSEVFRVRDEIAREALKEIGE